MLNLKYSLDYNQFNKMEQPPPRKQNNLGIFEQIDLNNFFCLIKKMTLV